MKHKLIAIAAAIVAFLTCTYILLMLGSVFMILPVLILPEWACMVAGWMITAFAVWHGLNAGAWAYGVARFHAIYGRR